MFCVLSVAKIKECFTLLQVFLPILYKTMGFKYEIAENRSFLKNLLFVYLPKRCYLRITNKRKVICFQELLKSLPQ